MTKSPSTRTLRNLSGLPGFGARRDPSKGLIGAGTNYLVCGRGFSRSGARLLADFEILEKARALQLGAASLSAIEARVQSTLEKQTEGSVGRSKKRATE